MPAPVYLIGNLLTGRRLQTLPVLDGPWSEALNEAGEVSATVSLRNPRVRRLGLANSAAPGLSFLIRADGDTLTGGPIWWHDWDEDTQKLKLTAAGMWSYFDHRVLLPVLAGRLPSDKTTDTRYMPQDLDPDSRYPWPTDTRKSLQGIARALVAQAQSETYGNVPVILPSEIAGTNEREYRGIDLAPVGDRLRELTNVLNGPDIRFTPRFTTDRLGVEWVMEIGTPTQPMLYSPRDVVFHQGLPRSSLTRLRARVNGTVLGSRAFSSGGKAVDVAIASVSTDSTLTAAGYPLLDVVDPPHQTATMQSTVQEYSDALVRRARRPETVISFVHDLSVRPFLSSFQVGDFAKLIVHSSNYLEQREHRVRIIARAGDEKGRKIDVYCAPEVV